MAPFAQTTLPAHLKPGIGRPSEYRPEFCDLLLEVTKQEGISLTAFAGLIGVARDTVYEWRTKHSAFSDACSRAKAMRSLWWERKLGRATKGAVTQASIFALRNIDPTEWRDVRSVQHDHAHRIETMTDAQLYAVASGKAVADTDVIDGECERVATR